VKLDGQLSKRGDEFFRNGELGQIRASQSSVGLRRSMYSYFDLFGRVMAGGSPSWYTPLQVRTLTYCLVNLLKEALRALSSAPFLPSGYCFSF
jgi:hypothetical protein